MTARILQKLLKNQVTHACPNISHMLQYIEHIVGLLVDIVLCKKNDDSPEVF